MTTQQIRPAEHHKIVAEVEATVVAECFHACACWLTDSPSAVDCSLLSHAEVRATATAVRAAALKHVEAVIRAYLPTVRRSDVDALSRALLAPVVSHE